MVGDCAQTSGNGSSTLAVKRKWETEAIRQKEVLGCGDVLSVVLKTVISRFVANTLELDGPVSAQQVPITHYKKAAARKSARSGVIKSPSDGGLTQAPRQAGLTQSHMQGHATERQDTSAVTVHRHKLHHHNISGARSTEPRAAGSHRAALGRR
ncbi:unnamed protein product [Pleuronectes platessa]|uniref:Uncharacterized protein n=1 Tax=Pleuronectes platessa TaxID=8262 RepID=A0A9N7VMD5_PLEPL|nr:unnamed protein product [Pleuronectes platessa]